MTTKIDHRPEVVSKAINYFTDKDIADLRVRFEFSDEFSLGAALEFHAYYYHTYPQPHSAADQRELLKELQKHSTGFYDVLSRLGLDEIRLIENISPDFSRDDVLSQVRMLNRAVGAIVLELAQLKLTGGPKKELAGRNLIIRLHGLYVRGTGRDDRYSQAADTGEYSGRFVAFVTRVCKLINAPLSNFFIGDSLKEYFKG